MVELRMFLCKGMIDSRLLVIFCVFFRKCLTNR
jgi:hypothetical protein